MFDFIWSLARFSSAAVNFLPLQTAEFEQG